MLLLAALGVAGLVSAKGNLYRESGESRKVYAKVFKMMLADTRYTFVTTCGETVSFVSNMQVTDQQLEDAMREMNQRYCPNDEIASIEIVRN